MRWVARADMQEERKPWSWSGMSALDLITSSRVCAIHLSSAVVDTDANADADLVRDDKLARAKTGWAGWTRDAPRWQGAGFLNKGAFPIIPTEMNREILSICISYSKSLFI